MPRQYAGSRNNLESYISGYFDGEGCFAVSISPRPTLKVGWEVRPSVSVSQNADRSEVLIEIKRYFACGSLRRDPGDRTLKWETRSLGDIVAKVQPHFEAWPLISGKRRDFELLAEICGRMRGGHHRAPSGLIEIVKMASEMNPSGNRRFPPGNIITNLSEMKA